MLIISENELVDKAAEAFVEFAHKKGIDLSTDFGLVFDAWQDGVAFGSNFGVEVALNEIKRLVVLKKGAKNAESNIEGAGS